MLVAWADPVVEAHGFPVNSAYTETVLLPILGPSSTFALRRLGTWAAAQPNGLPVDTAELAHDLGLSHKGGRNSTMARTISRLCQFGMAEWRAEALAVRTAVAPVAERQLARLSARAVARTGQPGAAEQPSEPSLDGVGLAGDAAWGSLTSGRRRPRPFRGWR